MLQAAATLEHCALPKIRSIIVSFGGGRKIMTKTYTGYVDEKVKHGDLFRWDDGIPPRLRIFHTRDIFKRRGLRIFHTRDILKRRGLRSDYKIKVIVKITRS
jgi:hypothetical protein